MITCRVHRLFRLILAFGWIVAALAAQSWSGAPLAAQPKGATPSTAPAPDQDLKALRERLEKLRREMAETEQGRGEAADQLRTTERTISESTRKLHELHSAQREARTALRAIDERARRVEGEAHGRSRDLERVLYWRHVHGDKDFPRLLLSGEDPQAISRDLHYYSYIAKAHADLILTLRSNVDELKQLAQDGRTKNEELNRLEAQAREQRAKLERERSEWRKVHANLSGQLKEQQRTLQTLRANEQRLTQLVERLARALRERTLPGPAPRAPERNDKVPEAGQSRGVFSSLRGRLRLPVRGDIVGRFGSSRADGGPTWKGVFIRAAEGEEVRAVANGRVVYAEWMRGFGNLLIVDHGEEYLSIYGYNESVLRRAGDTVRQGDAVATVGRSGGVEEAGLYFELRHQGRPIDPLGWVAR